MTRQELARFQKASAISDALWKAGVKPESTITDAQWQTAIRDSGVKPTALSAETKAQVVSFLRVKKRVANMGDDELFAGFKD